jgi:SAM-dependent methyltransferase
MASQLPGDATTQDVRATVRQRYASIARDETTPALGARVARSVGYDEGDLHAVPEGANLGLGCGNPVALASLRPGDAVLDLGSGAGFDALLAARAVGAGGRVIGVDMTPEMVAKARENAVKAGVTNVEFRLGTIEELPVESASVDVVISNCVINLSPQKPRVFAEAFRALRPGGRLMISDLVARGELPASVRRSVAAYVGCVAGVSRKDDYLRMLGEVGFDRIEIAGEKGVAEMLGLTDLANPQALACACADPVVSGLVGDLMQSAPMEDLVAAAGLVASVQIAAYKPIV